jgi:PPOX class probable F420-dependent enzyme
MALTQDEITRFLAGRRNAVLATNRRNGPPQLTTVWFLWNGETFQISTTRPRQKHANIRRDPRVTLCVDDPVVFRSVVVEGRAEIVEDGIWDTTRAIIDRYVDKPFAERLMARVRTEPRVLLVVHPEKWLSWDITEGVLPLR